MRVVLSILAATVLPGEARAQLSPTTKAEALVNSALANSRLVLHPHRNPDANGDAVPDQLTMEAELNHFLQLSAGRVQLLAGLRQEIRMFEREDYQVYRSRPVLTPSYNPGITVYVVNRRGNSAIGVGFHHYSNGQEDSFFEPGGCGVRMDSNFCLDGRLVNLKSGNFSTNYLRLSWPFQSPSGTLFHSEFEYHLYHIDGWGEPELRGRYGNGRLALTASQEFSVPNWFREIALCKSPRRRISGRLEVAGGDVSARGSLEVLMECPLLRGASVQYRFFRGRDDYNLRFPNVRTVLTIGFAIPFNTLSQI